MPPKVSSTQSSAKTAANAAAAGSRPPPTPPPTPLLRFARQIRTFSFTKWISYHPYTAYFAIVGFFTVWANVRQQQGLKGYFPDYDECVRTGSANQLGVAKLQEYADVQRYNDMVSTMRRDLKNQR